MSDNLKDSKEENIPGTMEDLRNVKKFWDHYKIPIHKKGMDWVDAKLSGEDQSLSLKDKQYVQYLIAFGHCTPTEVFKDEVFTKTNENSKKIVYKFQFDEDMDNMLAGEDLV